jgi:uncharacterized protein YndB with AHSA1/START domain
MTRPFRFDRRFPFDVPVDRLWEAVADTERYPEWFPWLARYDGGPLRAGTTTTFEVRPPLPYRLAITVDVRRVVPCELVEGFVGGDLAGPARLEVCGDGDASEARLTWELELTRRSLRRLERVARPVMVWGHDAVVAMGLRRFRRRAL